MCAQIVKADWWTKTELGSTGATSGASLIGIYDTGGYFTGTEVETALQELGASIVAESLWDRSGTSLIPQTAGDSIGLTGTRITKGWFTDLEITNMPTVSGTAIDSTFLLLDGTNIMAAAISTSAGTGLNFTAVQNEWAFKYDASLAPTVPDNTGLFFDLTTDLAFEFKVGGIDLFRIIADIGTFNANIEAGARGTAFDGSLATLGVAADSLWSSAMFQAYDNGQAGGYVGLWAKADATRDANESIAFIAEAFGAGALAFNALGGTNATSVGGGGVMYVYATNYVLDLRQMAANATAEVLRLTQDGTADILQWIDGGTQIGAINDTGQIYFRNTAEDKIYFNGDGGTMKISMVGTELQLDSASHIILNPATRVVIGDGSAGVDYQIVIDGATNDFLATWSNANDMLDVSDDIRMLSAENIYFRDTAIHINSSVDGQLDLIADVEIQIAAPLIDINGNVIIDADTDSDNRLTIGLGSASGNKGIYMTASAIGAGSSWIYCDGTAGTDFVVKGDGKVGIGTLTPAQMLDVRGNVIITTTSSLYLRDTALGINSSVDGQLDVFADAEVQIAAPTVDINASSEVNVSNDLTVGGELTGSRVIVTAGKQGVLSASAYLVPGVGGTFIFTATEGWVAHRAGSITGISVITSATVETTQGNLTFEVRVNDTPVYTKVIASNGVATVSGYDTQARGTNAFSAGDLISMYVTFTSFVGSIDDTAMIVELTLDT